MANPGEVDPYPNLGEVDPYPDPGEVDPYPNPGEVDLYPDPGEVDPYPDPTFKKKKKQGLHLCFHSFIVQNIANLQFSGCLGMLIISR